MNMKMDTIIKELSSPELITALENNMVEFWSRYGRVNGRNLYVGEDYVRVLTGIPLPLFNNVFRARLSPETVDDAINDTLKEIESWKVPLLWWVGPNAQPPDLGKYLELHGFSNVGNTPGMAIDLSILEENAPQPQDFIIRIVENIEMLEIWIRVTAEGSEFPKSTHDSIVSLEHNIGIDLDSPLHRYIGYWKNIPVASSAIFMHSGVAGVFAVATLPKARGQGRGSAMTRTTLIDARLNGYKVGTLQASKMGYPVYKKLGFQDVCSFGIYLAE